MECSVYTDIVQLCLLVSFCLLNVQGARASMGEVKVINLSINDTVANFPDEQAGFGPDFPDGGLEGRIMYADPIYACGKLRNKIPASSDKYVWILLISRGGNCQFADKVINAQKHNFSAAIIHNDNKTLDCNSQLTIMGGVNGSSVTIPSVFVGCLDGARLAKDYSYKQSMKFIVSVTGGTSLDYKMYLWPFAIVVAACFILVMVFLVIKFIRDHARQRMNRLSNRHLKKIPVRKFKKGDYYDTCAICLEEYEEGEKIRVLPCDHVYHTKCIDPWLTKNKKTCPVCKRRVIPGRDADSDDSDSDSDAGGGGRAAENTPLLGGQGPRGQYVGGQQGATAAPVVVRGVDFTQAVLSVTQERDEEPGISGTARVEGEEDQGAAETDRLSSQRQERRRRRRERRERASGGLGEGRGEEAVGGDRENLPGPSSSSSSTNNTSSTASRESKEERRQKRRKRRAEKMDRQKGEDRRGMQKEEKRNVVVVEAHVEEEEAGFVSARSSFHDEPAALRSEVTSQEEAPLLGAVGGSEITEDYVNPSYSESQEMPVVTGAGDKQELNQLV